VTLICAHRGASAYHPDSSRAAFTAAIEMGADVLETDVRRAPDGRLVLVHDRFSGDPPAGAIELAELVALAAGEAALDVELKEAGYEADVLAILDPRPAGLVVTSFLDRAIAAVRDLDPDVRTGLVVAPGRGPGGDPVARARACGAEVLVAHASIAPGLGPAVQAAALALWVWTVNDPARLAAAMADPAVACVVTDVPDVAVTARAAA
jgi:glycerophosphoryl diester phosphodiesterase